MPDIERRPLSADALAKLEQSLREYEAAKKGESAVGRIQQEYEGKFLRLLEEIKDLVNDFLSDKLDPQRRLLFNYAADEKLKEFIEGYTKTVETAAQKRMRNDPIYVETVEQFKESFYETLWPAMPPSMALRKGAGWAGRTTDYELAGYEERDEDIKAGIHIPGTTFILDKKTGAIIGKEPKRRGISFEAMWPLRKYVFPHDSKSFEKVEKVLNSLKKGAGSRKYEQEHGPKHLMHAVEYCHRIIEIERERPGNPPINEHMTYTMAGFHDFWRACDVMWMWPSTTWQLTMFRMLPLLKRLFTKKNCQLRRSSQAQERQCMQVFILKLQRRSC